MIYFDNASTTKLDDRLNEVIYKYNNLDYFNPSAPYIKSVYISKDIQNARNSILEALNANQNSVITFTSCATEANNTVLLGQLNKRYKKVLISDGEHKSIYNTINFIRNMGFTVETVKLTKDGCVDFDDFREKMTNEVGLVSFIHVSNETGAINPIKELCQFAKSINPNVLFHSDGVQAFGKINVNVSDLGVDFYTISGHKIHGPKGIAALYSKKPIKPYIIGGGQQNDNRSGTENVSGIMALGEIVKYFNIKTNYEYVFKLKAKFTSFFREVENVYINSSDNASPYIVSIGFSGVNGETLVHILEEKDICISTGSACSSKKSNNIALSSMGLNNTQIKGNVRVSFDIFNTEEEVDILCKELLDAYLSLYNKTNRR